MSKLILILFPVVVLGAGYGAAVMGFVKVPGVKAAHSSRAGYAADAEDPMLRTLKDQITGLRKQLDQARRSGASGASPSGDSAASGTVALYSREWRKFVGWCSMGGFDALPADPEIVALYVTALSRTQSVASMNVAVAAISQAHQAVRLASPTQTPAFREVWRGIRRTIGVAPREQKAPATTEVVKAMLEELPDSLIGVRDRALILVAFATAMRRSEIVGLDFEDVRYVERGMEITVRRSKVDQEGVGHVVAVPYGNAERTCPIRALRAWIEAAGLIGGPLFRSVDRHGRVSDGRMDGGSVGRIVKRAVERTGRDPQDFGAHSTRAGFITSAAANGASEHSIAKTSNHRSVQVLRSYIRTACRFDDNAGSKLGL